VANIITDEIATTFLDQAPELRSFSTSVRLELEPNLQPPFEYLVRAIIYQQLSGKAATTIHGRFIELVGNPSPDRILEYGQEELRSVGLSRQKAGYVRNAASAFLDELQDYRTSNDLDQMTKEEVIELLTQIKGVGRRNVPHLRSWTVRCLPLHGPRGEERSPGHLRHGYTSQTG